MSSTATCGGEHFVFGSLREVMAKANEEKAGDLMAGLAATSERERVAAKLALSEVALRTLLDEPLIEDGITDAISKRIDRPRFDRLLGSLTVGEFRELVLQESFVRQWNEEKLHALITPEIAAATAKLMSNLDLITAAAPLRVVTRCRSTVGGPGVFASRIQPNHPIDDPPGIALSVLDGLLLGSGDALLGVNRECASHPHRPR
jgi:ethanolamine ammonia-lyase large subunit